MRFLDALRLTKVDVLGFSLGGMVAQLIALQRPALFRRIILTGTGPEGVGQLFGVWRWLT
jgi:pimeloyl-ACP methyl ester carboxylesterase